MAKVVWLGSPDGPDAVEFMGFRFIKDEAVDIEDQHILARAANNQFFKVSGYSAETKHAAPVTYRPPSEQSAQGPVPKAGEPIVEQERFQEVDKAAKEPEDTDKSEDVEAQHPAVAAVHKRPPQKTTR